MADERFGLDAISAIAALSGQIAVEQIAATGLTLDEQVAAQILKQRLYVESSHWKITDDQYEKLQTLVRDYEAAQKAAEETAQKQIINDYAKRMVILFADEFKAAEYV